MGLRGCSWKCQNCNRLTGDEVWNTCRMLLCVSVCLHMCVAWPSSEVKTHVSWHDMWCRTFTGVLFIWSSSMTDIGFFTKRVYVVGWSLGIILHLSHYHVFIFEHFMEIVQWHSWQNNTFNTSTSFAQFSRMREGIHKFCMMLLKP